MSLVNRAKSVATSVGDNAVASVKGKISNLVDSIRKSVTGDCIYYTLPTVIIGGKPLRLTNTKTTGMELDFGSLDMLGQYSKITYTISGGVRWEFAGNKLDITLQDNDGSIEESIIINSNTRMVDVIFPFSETNTTKVNMLVNDINTEYGVTNEITLNCSTLGTDGKYSVGQKNSRTFRETTISEIVRYIIRDNPNWVEGEIEDTEPVKGMNGEPNAEFVQNNITDYDFINKILKPVARSSSTKISDYVFYVDDTTMPNKVHFCTRKNKEASSVYNFSIGDVRNAKDAVVISFSPKVSNLPMAIHLTDGAESKPVMIEDKNEYLESFIKLADERAGYEALASDIDVEYNKNRTRTLLQRTYIASTTATMELNGIDTSLKINDVIAIYAYRANGVLHYSSGKYYITEIVWNIENGKCTMELELKRDSTMLPEYNNITSDSSDTGKINKTGDIKKE